MAYIIGWLLLRLWDRCGWWALLLPAALMILPGSQVFAWHKTQYLLPFFVIGLLLARHGVSYDFRSIPSAACRRGLLLFSGAVVALSPLYIMRIAVLDSAQGPKLFLYCLGELLITGAVYFLLSGLYSACRPVQRFFGWFGQYTMEIYCIHMVFIKYLKVTTPAWVFPLPQALSGVYYFAAAIGVGAVCALLSRWVFNRIPLYRMFMLGQWPAKRRENDVPGPNARTS